MCKHDYQQQRVYDWQATLPSGGMVPFEQAQTLVEHIWTSEGLKYPPQCEPMHANMRKWAGTADRLTIKLQANVCLRTIIHELAHSMTSEMDRSEQITGHGPTFMGVYLSLLEKYMSVPKPVTLYTCSKYNVDVDVLAGPIFLDD